MDAGFEKPPSVAGRRCPCGAVALGAGADAYKPVVDAMIEHYGICPSRELHDVYAGTDWLRDFHIKLKKGPQAGGLRWYWFLRKLPWETPAGPMSDEERLAWLKEQGEKFYDMMYDSGSPGSDYRLSKESFEDAISLALKMGRSDEAEALRERLDHIKAIYRSQFS